MHALDLTGMTVEAVKSFGLSRKDASRAKNMFALGLLSWLYQPPDRGHDQLPLHQVREQAGHPRRQHHCLQDRVRVRRDHRGLRRHYEVAPAPMPPGRYRQISGNLALAYGLITAARKAGLPLFLGSYPITPASDVLHELSKHKRFGVTTFQAEDEIAGVGAALGASFVGQLGVTIDLRPGRRPQGRDDRRSG